jgi:hypothetical protein
MAENVGRRYRLGPHFQPEKIYFIEATLSEEAV